uniref:Uncharacterized protein n=1 Tax=Glossina austeni TaxID=7395 RepID=A0A1A9VS49_GLOAU
MLRTVSLLAIESFSYRWVVVQPPGHTTVENSQYDREASPQTSSRQRDSAVPIRRDFPARNRITPGNRAASAGVTVSQPSIWQANAWATVTETHRSPYGPVCPSSPNLRPSCQDSNRATPYTVGSKTDSRKASSKSTIQGSPRQVFRISPINIKYYKFGPLSDCNEPRAENINRNAMKTDENPMTSSWRCN